MVVPAPGMKTKGKGGRYENTGSMHHGDLTWSGKQRGATEHTGVAQRRAAFWGEEEARRDPEGNSHF